MDPLYNKTSLMLGMEEQSSIFLGSTSLNKMKIGNNNITKIYLGNALVFPISSSGLLGTRYIDYHNDNPSWFDTAIPHGDTNSLTIIENFSSSPNYSSEEYYSWQWIGYFKASSSEDYTFYTSSDDGSYLWIGNNAISGYNTSNALVNNGGPHGTQEVSGTISLVANTYYPIRIQFGEIGGGDIVTVSFSTNSIQKTTNGFGYYYKYIDL